MRVHSPALASKGFVGFCAVQFFGAANDNILKQVLLFSLATGGMWQDALGPGSQGYVGLALTLPFVLLSPWFGQFSDKWSKARVTWAVKVWEVMIALAAWLAFFLGSPGFALVCMVMLATQSALYGPAKYGIIPELVRRDQIGPASGLVNMLTNVAIIGGTALAGPVAIAYRDGATWAPGLALCVVALAGLAACLALPTLRAHAAHLRIRPDVVRCLLRSQWELRQTPVFLVALLDGGFYFIGMLGILGLPDFQSPVSGGLSIEQITIALVAMSVAVGIGGLAAGAACRRTIRPRLVPLGCAAMAAGFGAVGLLPVEPWRLVAWLFVGGLGAGVVIVVVQTMLLHMIAEHERGRVLGAVNTLSFLFMAGASVLYTVLRQPELGAMSAQQTFVACALLAIPGLFAAGALSRRLRVTLASTSNAS